MARNYVAWAQEFLRSMYPDLNNKRYTLSLEASVSYDKPSKELLQFELYVGDGPKGWVFGYGGGCMSPSPIRAEPPWPSELGPQPSPSAPPSAIPSPAAGPVQEKKIAKNCESGPVRPKQYLRVGFDFDNEGRLRAFGVGEPGLVNSESDTVLEKLVESRPEITEAEFATALKKAGVKYGPFDKEEFVKNLPLVKLRRFLGELRVISVEHDPFEHRFDWSTWPRWEVKAKAKRLDGTEVIYGMRFDRFKGDLLNLWVVSDLDDGIPKK